MKDVNVGHFILVAAGLQSRLQAWLWATPAPQAPPAPLTAAKAGSTELAKAGSPSEGVEAGLGAEAEKRKR